LHKGKEKPSHKYSDRDILKKFQYFFIILHSLIQVFTIGNIMYEIWQPVQTPSKNMQKTGGMGRANALKS